MRPSHHASRHVQKQVTRVMWTVMGFYFIGMLPTLIWKDPRAGMVLAAMAVIPLVVNVRKVRHAVAKAAGLGMVSGVAIAMMLFNQLRRSDPDAPPEVLARFQRTAWRAILGTALLCAAVGLVFSLMARRRRRLIDRQWDQASGRRE